MLISISRAFATAATFAPLILAAPTTTTPQQTAGNFKYSGCYADVSSRVLKTKTMAINNLTLEKCAAFCYSYALFGVESGYEVSTKYVNFAESSAKSCPSVFAGIASLEVQL